MTALHKAAMLAVSIVAGVLLSFAIPLPAQADEIAWTPFFNTGEGCTQRIQEQAIYANQSDGTGVRVDFVYMGDDNARCGGRDVFDSITVSNINLRNSNGAVIWHRDGGTITNSQNDYLWDSDNGLPVTINTRCASLDMRVNADPSGAGPTGPIPLSTTFCRR